MGLDHGSLPTKEAWANVGSQLSTHARSQSGRRQTASARQTHLRCKESLPVKSQCSDRAGRAYRLTPQALFYAEGDKRGMVASGGKVAPRQDQKFSIE